ncbi:hypothetical protein ACS0TY_025778 [Phlomoides rotata]
MPLFILIHLLALLPTNNGTPLRPIYLSPSQLPILPSLSRMNSPESDSIKSLSTSFKQILAARRRHFKHLPAALAPSPASQGPLSSFTGRTWPRHHHEGHKIRNHAVPPSPSATPGCGHTCLEPLTSAPFGSPCACVFPIRVRLLLGVSVFAIYPEATELEIEVAAGTYLKQSQVSILGINTGDLYEERAVVDINLVPLGEKFDNTTATLIYRRFLHKKVPLNRTIFGDYDVMYITYPGLPPPPSGEAPSGSTGNHQNPITAEVGEKHKMNPLKISVIALSATVPLVVCLAAIAVLLNCRKVGIPSSAVDSLSIPSVNKRSGIRFKLSRSPASSTPASLVSAMSASILSVKTFSLVELEIATEKFSPKKLLGEGGFGRVYHGVMRNGTEVAVKFLTRNNQNGDREFIAEIEMLSRLHHRNLVKLIGICIDKQTRCLVYDLVPNGSVESHLHGADKSKGPLDWDARLKIALGAARGLAYLHEDSNPRVIHRDFKASNILLENDFTARVSDFGLAREAMEGSDHISTQVMGTFGYVAPEYAMTGHLLVKSDVYSYGVVLLELLSGRKPVDMSRHPGQENLVTWARPSLTNREGLEQLVDPSLAGSYDFDHMAKVAAIASMCVHPEVAHRPFMGEVVQALKIIYNDTYETCGDAYSQKDSSAPDSDLKGDYAPSDSSWWNAGGTTPRLTYGQASSFITMEYSSGSPDERVNRLALVEGGPAWHGNRSGPLRIIRSDRAFHKLQRSMSENRGLIAKRAIDDYGGFTLPP